MKEKGLKTTKIRGQDYGIKFNSTVQEMGNYTSKKITMKL